MTKERRTELILQSMGCLLRHFTFNDEINKNVEEEICKGCGDKWVCKYVWRPHVKQQIRGILDDEFQH